VGAAREKTYEPVKIGVLGCGPIAQAAHFEAIRRAKNAELHAICDLADDLRERMAEIHRPNVSYASYEEMLADPAVEAVVIAVADQFHVPMALKAIEAGKNVLVEKPLGVAIEEAETLATAVRGSGLVLNVGSMKRFDPGIAFARGFIRDEMGEMLALKAWYCDSTHRYALTDNVQPIIVQSAQARRPAGDPKADKRRYFMLGHGSHLVDTARFLGGEIIAVRGRLAEKYGAWSWFVDVEFASGALGHLDLTIAVRMDWHEGFQIYGEHGSVLGKTYNPWLFKSSDVECFSERDGQYHRLLGADAHFYRLQIEGFADTIRTGADHGAASAEDGLAAVRAMVAIARSVETGAWCRLADMEGAV
jgi:predicted dehydrogenase